MGSVDSNVLSTILSVFFFSDRKYSGSSINLVEKS